VIAWFGLIVSAAVIAWCVVDMARIAGKETPEVDRLAGTVSVWLADERPAWETVAAFERDVERVLSGDVTADYVERMPLRPRGERAGVLPRLGTPGYTGPVVYPKRCRHRWTTIPPRTVDAMEKATGSRPDETLPRRPGLPEAVQDRRPARRALGPERGPGVVGAVAGQEGRERMSYARFAEDSDVYVFLSIGGHLECCSCRLKGKGQCASFKTTDEMLSHLREHREAGHDVPERTFERLQRERDENDTYMAA
jgi:hypothetical protein